MRRVVVLALALVLEPLLACASQPKPAPEFPSTDPSHWVGTPVTLRSLRGKVVMLEVWTFG
jgi:hypothetical protein